MGPIIAVKDELFKTFRLACTALLPVPCLLAGLACLVMPCLDVPCLACLLVCLLARSVWWKASPEMCLLLTVLPLQMPDYIRWHLIADAAFSLSRAVQDACGLTTWCAVSCDSRA